MQSKCTVGTSLSWQKHIDFENAASGRQPPRSQHSPSVQPTHAAIMRLLLFTASLVAPASAFAGTFGPDAANFSTMIRSTVLQGYDNMVPPRSDRSASAKADFGGYYSDAGTDVRMQVRFFKVSEVAAASGRMSLKVWHRLYWTDTRLSWDPADYGGVDTIYYGGGNVGKGESNEVWIPDLQPYNAYTGLMHTLDHGLVRVKSDGAVFYSRPGMIDVMCKFSGLVAFPFDKLKCQLEFGGWILSGGHQGVQLEGDGYQFSPQEATAGSSYTEYTIKDIEVEYADYKYDCCPSEPWPVVLYTITMERSSVFYYTIILVPGVLITLLSFAVFWSETESADPLGYGVTIIVVNLLSNIVLLEMLPVCGELLWVDMFSLTNTCFCCISLFQSSVCIMLETFEGDHIVRASRAAHAIMLTTSRATHTRCPHPTVHSESAQRTTQGCCDCTARAAAGVHLHRRRLQEALPPRRQVRGRLQAQEQARRGGAGDGGAGGGGRGPEEAGALERRRHRVGRRRALSAEAGRDGSGRDGRGARAQEHHVRQPRVVVGCCRRRRARGRAAGLGASRRRGAHAQARLLRVALLPDRCQRQPERRAR